MALDLEAAKEAIRTHIAEPMGLGVTAAAHGIYRVVNENMISATRVHVTERGTDPRKLRLIAFGGAGPVHAHEIAKVLKMRGYLCPASAGVASALGFLTAPTSFGLSRTFIAKVTKEVLPRIDQVFESLEAEGRATLELAGVEPEEMRFLRQADLRHQGQGHQIVVTLPDRPLAQVDLDAELRPLFYDTYDGIFGHAHRHLGLEVTTCRLTATGPAPEVRLRQLSRNGAHVSAAVKGTRKAFFAESGGYVDTPLYDRAKLHAGATFAGPAIVEDIDSTAVIGPGTHVEIDAYANLVVTFG
jgi:N-methylhydantoinase A